ncbi:hypothetical protein C8R48DRAFT_718682 [Suillus tomentosus]|nr:hypothetical protein C8R48DRAFT_718682 [Suillus tomentosus]
MMGMGLGVVVMTCHSAAAELCMTSILTKQLTHQRRFESFDMTLDVTLVHTALTFTYAIAPCFIHVHVHL